ncbi:MAG: MauE/DoxX family redox-associated membrane protein [Acidobacteriota bacterium]
MYKTKILTYNKSIILICRIILGTVFIYASIDKILNPEAFAAILSNYKLLPDFFIYAPALILPWLELVAGSFLIAGIFIRGSSFILNGLLVVFITAITINIARGLSFDCGCFSTLTGTGSNVYLLLFRDILLLIPGSIIFFHYNIRRRNGSKD